MRSVDSDRCRFTASPGSKTMTRFKLGAQGDGYVALVVCSSIVMLSSVVDQGMSSASGDGKCQVKPLQAQAVPCELIV